MRKPKTVAPGKLVSVNGHKMHVFSEGQGNKTFIFMSGSGTACPTLDFKPLWSLLSNKHKIVVVEKAGYGWSESTSSPRDIDTILSETREALKLAEIEAPYFLIPHSFSGLEALYWSQKYPSEVKGIIGLDSAIPKAYEIGKLPPKFIMKILNMIGAFSDDMVNESNFVKENANKVKNLPLPVDTPIYFFLSNGKGLLGIKNWEEMMINFLSDFKVGKHMSLGCGHYVHRYEAKKIATEINAFVSSIV